jgi:hypothetical protein
VSLERCLLPEVPGGPGWHPEGTAEYASVITHEFGHQVWNWLDHKYSNMSLTKYVKSDGATIGGTILREWVQKNRTAENIEAISRYARKNAAETWAEGFSMIYHAPDTKVDYVVKQKALIEFFKSETWYNDYENLYLATDKDKALAEIEEFEKKYKQIFKDIGVSELIK